MAAPPMPMIERIAERIAAAAAERASSPVELADAAALQHAKHAAVAVLLHDPGTTGEPGSDLRVLLMRRTERAGDPWSGHVSLPGGRYEPSDPDLLATAIRETREELGVELANTRVLGSLAPLHPRNSGPGGIAVTAYVFATTAAVEPHTGPEAAAVFWLPLALAASGALDAPHRHEPSNTSWPSWRYEGHTIWGLTMRILGEILELAR